MTPYLICRYHEIVLKGKNRRFFENCLRENVKRALKGTRYPSIRRMSGRLLIELNENSDVDRMEKRLLRVFGLATISRSWLSSQQLEQLERDAWSLIEGRHFETFKINTRRAPHSVSMTSPQVNQRIGAYVQERCQRPVDLKNPQLSCNIDLVEDKAFIDLKRRRGSGGLPSGTSGKVVVLMSGGIDSPVAAYKIMKRGCRAIFVHFHSYPHTTRDSQDKVRKLVEILNRYQYGSRLYLVPFADCQRRIVAFSPAPTRVVLYRRLMIRIAGMVASREKALALVTGDSLGQVASQTLENLNVVSATGDRTILRPLIGDDKEEIVSRARELGTYPVSILPDQDCCTLFVPKHPEIRAKLDRIVEIEAELDMDDTVRQAIRDTRMEKIAWDPMKLEREGSIQSNGGS